MKKSIFVVIALVCSSVIIFGQDYQTAFNDVQQQFEQRLITTPNALSNYLDNYPYSVYEDEIYTMQAVLHAEMGLYENAIKTFSKVQIKHLSRTTEPMYHFYLGYAYIQLKNYSEALKVITKVKNKQSPYSLQINKIILFHKYLYTNILFSVAKKLNTIQMSLCR